MNALLINYLENYRSPLNIVEKLEIVSKCSDSDHSPIVVFLCISRENHYCFDKTYNKNVINEKKYIYTGEVPLLCNRCDGS